MIYKKCGSFLITCAHEGYFWHMTPTRTNLEESVVGYFELEKRDCDITKFCYNQQKREIVTSRVTPSVTVVPLPCQLRARSAFPGLNYTAVWPTSSFPMLILLTLKITAVIQCLSKDPIALFLKVDLNIVIFPHAKVQHNRDPSKSDYTCVMEIKYSWYPNM